MNLVLGNKKWWQSKAVIGGIVAFSMPILTYAGIKISPMDLTEIINIFGTIATGLGSLLAIYGRVTAKDTIDG